MAEDKCEECIGRFLNYCVNCSLKSFLEEINDKQDKENAEKTNNNS